MADTRSTSDAPTTRRRRASSIKQALNSLGEVGSNSTTATAQPPAVVVLKQRPAQPSFLTQLRTFQWMVNPLTSLKMIVLVLCAYAALEVGLPAEASNPLAPFVALSYQLTPTPTESTAHYAKGWKDVQFLLFYIVVFSFARQSVTEFVVRPLASRLGIKTESKTVRFMEQAYGVVYWGWSSVFGLVVMRQQASWWYDTDQFWVDYPHARMSGLLKSYYLLQFSYWIQQMLVLILRLEKPRSDFHELVAHHIVTLHLILWSYVLDFTQIGTAIFVSMDLPDVFFALSKCLNYLDLQHTSEVSFVWFLGVWHYLRIYQNLRILYSVWTRFDSLVPEWHRTWTSSPGDEWWVLSRSGLWGDRLPPWLKWQVFLPIALLAALNIFWSVLIWRVLYRMFNGFPAKDVREEEEDAKEEAALERDEQQRARGLPPAPVEGDDESKKKKK